MCLCTHWEQNLLMKIYGEPTIMISIFEITSKFIRFYVVVLLSHYYQINDDVSNLIYDICEFQVHF